MRNTPLHAAPYFFRMRYTRLSIFLPIQSLPHSPSMKRDPSATRPPSHPLAFALFITRRHLWWAVGAITAVTFGELMMGTLVIALKNFVDAIATVTTNGYAAVWWWGMFYPVAYFVMESIWRVSGFTGMQWITRTRATVHRILFSYLTRHSSTFFNERFAGALTNKIANAARGTSDILSAFLWELYPLVIGFFVQFFLAFFQNPWLGIILGAWVILFLGINIVLVIRKQPYSYKAAETSSVLRGKMVDATTNIAAVHQGGQHAFEQSYLDRFIEAHRTADYKNWWISEWILLLNGALIALFVAAMIGASVLLLQKSLITIGVVVMMVNIVLDITRSLFFIGHKMTDFMDNYGQVEEGLGELLIPHEIIDDPDARPLALREGFIAFQDVRFQYGKNVVFRGLQLSIPGGQKVGLVGLSGAGKTTLVNLILRQYEIANGTITIDGQDIRLVTLESLRKGIATVPQDVTLFHRSIRENIRYGKLDASDADVEHAAALAQAHAFIQSLPKGYDTYVGERGVKLSGGQRQRVAVARAMLKQARILVLDEATSSLDSESEAAIQTALAELMKGKTVLAIAHRLSTLMAMDRIVVLSDGEIVEDGTHRELLERDAIYARLWKSQVRGFIQE